MLSETLDPTIRSSSGTYEDTDTTKSGPVVLLTTARWLGSTSLREPMIRGGLFSLSSSFLSLVMSF